MHRRILGQYAALLIMAALGIIVALLVHDSVFLVAFFTFAAVVSAAMMIAWAAEASQFSISQGLALAVVAIVQTLPEFFVEGTIAWKAGKDLTGFWLSNVIANFTGANRLLTGLGWPLILFTAEIQRRRTGQSGPAVIGLRREQSVEVIFMLGASLYYLLILFKETLTLLDSLILSGTFLAYMWILSRLPLRKRIPRRFSTALRSPWGAASHRTQGRCNWRIVPVFWACLCIHIRPLCGVGSSPRRDSLRRRICLLLHTVDRSLPLGIS